MISSRLQILPLSHLARRFKATGLSGLRWDRLIPWLLAGFAAIYYALYATAGLNLGGEGGTDGVVAMRLMSGQLPIVDTFLGYNVMWFFPVAGMFELTGPNYLALRWYFFTFCTTSGLLTYFVVHGYTRNAWYAALPAVLVILVPGMQFRNYMPFLGILNALLLTRAFVMRRESWLKSLAWMLAAGSGLGLTFLFRIDLGIFCTLMFLGLAALYPFGERAHFVRRSGLAVAGATGGLLLAAALHLPVWNDAKARGYDRAFLEQYTGWLEMISSEFRQQIVPRAESKKLALPAVNPAANSPASTGQPSGASGQRPHADTWEDRGALARTPLSDVIRARKWTDKSFAISTYFPIFLSAFAIVAGAGGLLAAIIRTDLAAKERFLYPLTVLGCALTLFPQFYFFRPDTPHLSEMMVPFLAALALFIWAAVHLAISYLKKNCPRPATSQQDAPPPFSSRLSEASGDGAFCGKALQRRNPALGYSAATFAAFCVAAGAIYFSHAFPKESSGSIAAKKKVSHEFRALNGVNVKVRDREAVWLPKLRDAVLRHSSPGEYVLCLPYSPTINFMTDRPSPLYNLYVDNSTAGKKFAEAFLGIMRKSSPPVVVIDQRRINRNEISRFRNWAPEPYQWLWDNYVFFGRYFQNEVFIRKDRAEGSAPPEYIEVSD